MSTRPEKDRRCSFCNKHERDVEMLIAGPVVYICNECIDICVDIVKERRADEEADGIICSLCSKVFEEAASLQLQSGKTLCVECGITVVDAVEKSRQEWERR